MPTLSSLSLHSRCLLWTQRLFSALIALQLPGFCPPPPGDHSGLFLFFSLLTCKGPTPRPQTHRPLYSSDLVLPRARTTAVWHSDHLTRLWHIGMGTRVILSHLLLLVDSWRFCHVACGDVLTMKVLLTILQCMRQLPGTENSPPRGFRGTELDKSHKET